MPSSSPTATGPGGTSSADAVDRLAALRAVPDPRPGGARRHPTAFVLGVLVMSMASAGFESFSGAAQWAAAADPALLLALGAAPDPLTAAVGPPSEATLRRVVAGIDREAFEAVAAAWTAGQLHGPGPGPETARLAVAIDGKTVRGARTGDQAAPHLLAACTHATLGWHRWSWRNERSPARPTRSPWSQRSWTICRPRGMTRRAWCSPRTPCTPSTAPPSCSTTPGPATC